MTFIAIFYILFSIGFGIQEYDNKRKITNATQTLAILHGVAHALIWPAIIASSIQMRQVD